MVPRKTLAYDLVDWVGGGEIHLINAARGWPSDFDCRVRSETVRVAAYLGRILLSMRERDEVERRFQNPGKDHPVRAPKREIPILLGMDEIEGQRVLVGMDAYKRVGKVTRQSLFMPLRLLELGITQGWAEHVNTSGERIIAFVPPLLPLFVDAYRAKRAVTEREIRAGLRLSRHAAVQLRIV